MSDLVWVAIIGGVPATIASVAQWRTSRQVRTSNGRTLGQLVEDLDAKIDEHTAQDNRNFAELWQGQLDLAKQIRDL